MIYIYDRKRMLEATSETSGCRCERPQSELFQYAKVVSVKYVQPQKAVSQFCAEKGGADMGYIIIYNVSSQLAGYLAVHPS